MSLIRSAVTQLVEALTKRAETTVRQVASPLSALATIETPEVSLWNQFSRIGGGLTPAIVSDIIREADAGVPYRLVDLLHECRQKDGHLQAVLGTRELAVVGLDWSIELPDNAKRRDRKANERLEEALLECDTFPLLIAHEIGEGNLFGYAFAEAVWRYEENGALKGLLVPDYFEPINSRRFGYRQADGKLLFNPEPYGVVDNTGVDLIEEYAPGKYVTYQPRINGDVQIREGLARVLIWLSCFRNWDMRDWLQLGETSWKPWRIGTYQRGANEEDVAALKLAMRTLTTAGAAVISDQTSIDIQRAMSQISGTGSVHKELIEQLGAEMSKAVLGGTLTVEAGARGARSLGDVHDSVRKDIREADARGVESFVTEYICAPFIRHNFGPNALVGKFRLNTSEGVDLEKLANAVDKLAGKIDIPQSWVRDQGGIREPKPGEQLVLFTGAAANQPKNPDDGKTGNSQDQNQGQEDTQ